LRTFHHHHHWQNSLLDPYPCLEYSAGLHLFSLLWISQAVRSSAFAPPPLPPLWIRSLYYFPVTAWNRYTSRQRVPFSSSATTRKGTMITSQFSSLLLAERPMSWSSRPGRVKNLHHTVETGSGVHPATHPMGTEGSFLVGKAAWHKADN
jgi:hypothetical protein